LVRRGSAVEEKKGAKATIPLTRTKASVIAPKKLVHSGILFSSWLLAFSL
jgi:hypothetical protein